MVLEPQLRNEVEQKSSLEKEIQDLENKLNQFSNSVGPVTALEFQAYAI